MKTVVEVAKIVVVTSAVYGWLAVQVAREVRYALTRRTREKYVQRPVDF
jgi:hypothetical protein